MKDDESSNGPDQHEGASTISDGQENRREPQPAPKPSQAEGDRETVEQDLKEKQGERET